VAAADRLTYAKLGAAGRSYAETAFNISAVADRLEANIRQGSRPHLRPRTTESECSCASSQIAVTRLMFQEGS
jgi:hypothetical protein